MGAVAAKGCYFLLSERLHNADATVNEPAFTREEGTVALPHIQARSNVSVLASVRVNFSRLVGQVVDNFRIVLNDAPQLWGRIIPFGWVQKQQ